MWTRAGKSLLQLEKDLHPAEHQRAHAETTFCCGAMGVSREDSSRERDRAGQNRSEDTRPSEKDPSPKSWESPISRPESKQLHLSITSPLPRPLGSGCCHLLPVGQPFPGRLLLLAQGAGKGRGAFLAGPKQRGTTGLGAPHREAPGLRSEAPRSGEPPQLLQP